MTCNDCINGIVYCEKKENGFGKSVFLNREDSE